jgi:hypothetical protein
VPSAHLTTAASAADIADQLLPRRTLWTQAEPRQLVRRNAPLAASGAYEDILCLNGRSDQERVRSPRPLALKGAINRVAFHAAAR